MGMGMTTTSTTVTISGAVSTTITPPVLGTAQHFVGVLVKDIAFTAGTGVTIYTVTAGHTLYIYGINMCCEGANQGRYWIKNGAGTCYCCMGSNQAQPYLMDFMNSGGGIIATFAAGDTVIFDGTSTLSAAVNKTNVYFWGIEV